MTFGFNTVLLLAATIMFILGIFVDEYTQELLLAGLAAFAAAHLPLN